MVPRISSHRQRWEADARTTYRLMGNAELAAAIESLQYDRAEARASYDPAQQAVVEDLVGRRLELATEELKRRESLIASGADVRDPNRSDYAAWRDLARQVRERGDIALLLETAGFRLRRHGQGYAAACPSCGGEDRYVVWPAANGKPARTWCRQCDLREDIIDVYQNHFVPGSSFYDATRMLGLQLGLRPPDYGSRAPKQKPARSRRRIVHLHPAAPHAR